MDASNPISNGSPAALVSASTSHSPPNPSLDTTSKNPAWYIPDIGPRLNPPSRSFYENYVGLKGGDLEAHLYYIRSRAWPLSPYPCVGIWSFLSSPLSLSPAYPSILSKAHAGGTILELGCGFGQELRRLAADGAPTENMLGSDVSGELWELGYELFRDRERMRARFVRGDVFSVETREALVGGLRGNGGEGVDVVLAYQFFHLFSLERQVELAEVIAGMVKPGGMVVGMQMGRVEAGGEMGGFGEMFYHDVASWRRMWEDVGRETGTKWKVGHVRMRELREWGVLEEDYAWMDGRNRALDFVVERVEDE